MVARLFFCLLTVPALVLLPPALSPLAAAQAAGYTWQSGAATVKRPQFRPLSHANPDWGGSIAPRSSGPRTQAHAAVRNEPVFAERAGARKANPVTRGQELGLRFRPDERASPYPDDSPVAPASGSQAPEQAQFRPTGPRRRATYEELQATEVQRPLPVAPSPYAPLLQPPVMPPQWPIWSP